MKAPPFKINFILVLLLHLILLITVNKSISDQNKVGYENQQVINTKIFFTVPKKGEVANFHSSLHRQLSSHQQKSSVSKLKSNNPHLSNMTSVNLKLNSATQGKKDELLMLLHNAINQTHIYPESARLENQTGEVILSFKLLPNGYIKDILISKSSGSSILDQAAVSAIKKIIPFQSAKNYLTTETFFEIPIDYQD